MRNVYIGLASWIVILAGTLLTTSINFMDEVSLIITFAMLVLAPLVLALLPTDHRLYTLLTQMHPIAALIASAAFLFNPGILAVLFALIWLVFTVLVALLGVIRLLDHGWGLWEEFAVNLGLIYLPVGAVWLVMDRADFQPLEFSAAIVRLTAAHFHVIPLGALVIAGMIGRLIHQHRPSLWKFYLPIITSVVIAPLFVALGITFSDAIEVVASIWLALALFGVALVVLIVILPAISDMMTKTLLAVSALAVIATMLFASLYALGSFNIPTMVSIHGWVNAVGFAFMGLLALSQLKPAMREKITPVPPVWERLRSLRLS
ncbi:MAG: YndJ family protein [Chloroflexi bacterium]|nr:YndJ family protein [Chloroflexota bacterium]